MLRPWVFIGFTGHRNLANPGFIEPKIREVLDTIATRTRSPLAAVSSAAIGADTLFVRSILQRHIPWTLLLPFPPALFINEKDFPNESDRRIFSEELAPSAVQTIIESRPETEPLCEKTRDHAFLECGLRTVEECDVLVAVWDELPPASGVGTSRIISYARQLNRPILWIHALTGKITEEHPEQLDALAASEAPPATADDGLVLLEQTFSEFNRTAKAKAPFAKYLTMSVVILHQASIAVAILALLWLDVTSLQTWAGWGKVCALSLALFLPWYFHHTQTAWMNHRLQAEMCRSARAIWHLRNPKRVFPALRLPVFERLQRSLLLLRLRSEKPTLPIEEVKTAYTLERLQHQIGYYGDQTAKAARHRQWLKILSYICTGLAIILGLALALHWPAQTDPAYKPLKLIALTLPLVATALVAAVTAHDMDRRVARYREIQSTLERAKIRLEARATWDGVADIAIEVERMLLLENWEWYSVSRFSASH